ncbi:quinone oxidoreductase family protein [Peribacillus deserti]|uniref:Quinone oxidoreductase n=1 Tax=Peribacillus deserti TaxID=673318 RepID=A0A2N5M4F0_9BACI|nr:quinone oxidoreductase [Peribacillus deserti]PLT29239.1 quinone oxidoreductase [Peribacillus deserti]
MKALVFSQFGGPEVLTYTDIPEPVISSSEILVEMKAIGLNFADVYRRKGNYHLAGEPPYILGYEGAGVVVKTGEAVSQFKQGDRVAFADVPYANAEKVSVPASHAIPLPDDISFETAASLLLQGLTAQYLTHDSYKLKSGDTVLIHAAAGGVGQLLTGISKHMGAKAIGLTSSGQKRQTAIEAGAEHVFLYNENWKEEVLSVTEGKGVDVVYESVGSTLADSFAAARIGGTVVFFGMAGGDPAPVDPRMLMDTSKTLTGGDLWNFLTSSEERISRSAGLFQWIRNGAIQIAPPAVFKLKDGAEAHAYIESRKSTGKILLIP